LRFDEIVRPENLAPAAVLHKAIAVYRPPLKRVVALVLPEELVARRRRTRQMTLNSAASLATSASPVSVFVFGPFQLSGKERLLQRNGEPLAISSRGLEILIALVERPGEVISHKELIDRAWPNVVVEDTNLRVHIANLRKVLRDTKTGPRYIMSVPGRGYCFVAKVDLTYTSGSLGWQSSLSAQITDTHPTDALIFAEGQVQLGFQLLRNALAMLQARRSDLAASEISAQWGRTD
jgi:DNA-binding winged helix-turn-helix (wHTH) protein